MTRRSRRSVAGSLGIAWALTGAAGVLAAGQATAPVVDDGPRYAVGLATAGFLVVLLLLLRMARRRGGAPVALPIAAVPEVPPIPPTPDRLVVRFDAVPLVDRPDDVHGRTLDDLGAGDVVDVMERESLWIRVRTEQGRVGWVAAMTLATEGDLPAGVVDDAATQRTESPPDDGPPLEAILEAIVAERRARAAASTQAAPDARPKRPRGPRATTRSAEAAPARPSRRRAAASGS